MAKFLKTAAVPIPQIPKAGQGIHRQSLPPCSKDQHNINKKSLQAI
jgi:hypothetical protein